MESWTVRLGEGGKGGGGDLTVVEEAGGGGESRGGWILGNFLD